VSEEDEGGLDCRRAFRLGAAGRSSKWAAGGDPKLRLQRLLFLNN
jgi:hypothetical protein